MSKQFYCKTIVYYCELTNEIVVCPKVPTWQGDNGGLACDEHKDNLFNPRPIEDSPLSENI